MKLLRGALIAAGLVILAAIAHTNIIAAGGYAQPGVPLLAAMPVGVAALSMALGYTLGEGRWLLAVLSFAFLCSGEVANFLTTAERLTNVREDHAAPVHEAAAKRKAAEDWVARLERDDRVARAEATLARARSEGVAVSEGKSCNKVCGEAIAAAVRSATAAVDDAWQSLQLEQRQARAALAGAPLPGSASPLADRLGLPGWVIDLTSVGLYSLALSGMAACLLAIGAHGRKRRELSPLSSPSRAQPLELTGNVVAIARAKPSRLPVKIGDVDAFMLDCVAAEAGSRLSWVDAFVRYRAWCEQQNATAVDVSAFGARLDALRAELGLETRTKGKEVFFVGLKLAS